MWKTVLNNRIFQQTDYLTKTITLMEKAFHGPFQVRTFCNGLDMQSITKGDPTLEHKMKVIQLEAEVLRQDGKLVPCASSLKEHHWIELLKMPTISARRKYFTFLFKTEKKREHNIIKKEKRREERLTRPERPPDDGTITYGLGSNNIFLRFYDPTINQMYNNKLVQAMQFGQKIVVDCGYDSDMVLRENTNCAKQLMYLFAENRLNDDPFDVHFCNANMESTLINGFQRHIPIMLEPWFPVNIHEKSYLDLFPKEKLVYLTPHCREELTTYNHDDIYIIGALVDKINNEPLSMAKAKREGIRMAKLPLDRYLQWGSGSGKSLTLNQVLSILLDVKNTGDWPHALRHVPRRKLADGDVQEPAWKTNRRENLPNRSWKPSTDTRSKQEKPKSKIHIRSLMFDEN